MKRKLFLRRFSLNISKTFQRVCISIQVFWKFSNVSLNLYGESVLNINFGREIRVVYHQIRIVSCFKTAAISISFDFYPLYNDIKPKNIYTFWKQILYKVEKFSPHVNSINTRKFCFHF